MKYLSPSYSTSVAPLTGIYTPAGQGRRYRHIPGQRRHRSAVEGDKYFIVPQSAILMLEREEDI